VLGGTISTKDRRSGRIGSGSAVVTSSVVSSTAFAVILLSVKMYPSTLQSMSESVARLMENAAASAVNGESSWNLTPSRRVKVHEVGEFRVHLVASACSRRPVDGSRSVSASVMLARVTRPVAVSEASQGSRVGGSSGSTTRRVPGPSPMGSPPATEHPETASSTTTDANAPAVRPRRIRVIERVRTEPGSVTVPPRCSTTTSFVHKEKHGLDMWTLIIEWVASKASRGVQQALDIRGVVHAGGLHM
jgi:hypothetical protein